MTQIAVIGSGTMGNGIAHVFAQNGFPVNLIDLSEEALRNALQTITKNLDRQVTGEKITEEIKQKALDNLKTFTDLKSAVANANLVVEAATENESIKLKILLSEWNWLGVELKFLAQAKPTTAIHCFYSIAF